MEFNGSEQWNSIVKVIELAKVSLSGFFRCVCFYFSLAKMFLEPLLCRQPGWQLLKMYLKPSCSTVNSKVGAEIAGRRIWLDIVGSPPCVQSSQLPSAHHCSWTTVIQTGDPTATRYRFPVTLQLPLASLLLHVCALITHTFCFSLYCLSNPHLSEVKAEVLSPAQSSASRCIRALFFFHFSF